MSFGYLGWGMSTPHNMDSIDAHSSLLSSFKERLAKETTAKVKMAIKVQRY